MLTSYTLLTYSTTKILQSDEVMEHRPRNMWCSRLPACMNNHIIDQDMRHIAYMYMWGPHHRGVIEGRNEERKKLKWKYWKCLNLVFSGWIQGVLIMNNAEWQMYSFISRSLKKLFYNNLFRLLKIWNPWILLGDRSQMTSQKVGFFLLMPTGWVIEWVQGPVLSNWVQHDPNICNLQLKNKQ